MAENPIHPTYLAFFSTHGGQFAPRSIAKHGAPAPVVRADPLKDRDDFIAGLRSRYPHEALGIFAKSSDSHEAWDIRWFFDEHDFYRLGGRWLYTVLSTMQKQNEELIVRYVDDWDRSNQVNWPIPFHQLTWETAFCQQDKQRFGQEFLRKALLFIQLKWRNTCQAHAQFLQQLHVQHAQLLQNHDKTLAHMRGGQPQHGNDQDRKHLSTVHSAPVGKKTTTSRVQHLPLALQTPTFQGFPHAGVTGGLQTSKSSLDSRSSGRYQPPPDADRRSGESGRCERRYSVSAGGPLPDIEEHPTGEFEVTARFIGSAVDCVREVNIKPSKGNEDKISLADISKVISAICPIKNVAPVPKTPYVKVSVYSTEDARRLVTISRVPCKGAFLFVAVPREYHTVPGPYGSGSRPQQGCRSVSQKTVPNKSAPSAQRETHRRARGSSVTSSGDNNSLYSPQDARSGVCDVLQSPLFAKATPPNGGSLPPTIREEEESGGASVKVFEVSSHIAPTETQVKLDSSDSEAPKVAIPSAPSTTSESNSQTSNTKSLQSTDSHSASVSGVDESESSSVETHQSVASRPRAIEEVTDTQSANGKTFEPVSTTFQEPNLSTSRLQSKEGHDLDLGPGVIIGETASKSTEAKMAVSDSKETMIEQLQKVKVKANTPTSTEFNPTTTGVRALDLLQDAQFITTNSSQLPASARNSVQCWGNPTDALPELHVAPQPLLQGLGISTITTDETVQQTLQISATTPFPPSPALGRDTPKSFNGTLELSAWRPAFNAAWDELEKLPPASRSSLMDQCRKLQSELDDLEDKYTENQLKLVSGSKTVKGKSRQKSNKATGEQRAKAEELVLLQGQMHNEIYRVKGEEAEIHKARKYPSFDPTAASFDTKIKVPKGVLQWPYIPTMISTAVSLRRKRSGSSVDNHSRKTQSGSLLVVAVSDDSMPTLTPSQNDSVDDFQGGACKFTAVFQHVPADGSASSSTSTAFSPGVGEMAEGRFEETEALATQLDDEAAEQSGVEQDTAKKSVGEVGEDAEVEDGEMSMEETGEEETTAGKKTAKQTIVELTTIEQKTAELPTAGPSIGATAASEEGYEREPVSDNLSAQSEGVVHASIDYPNMMPKMSYAAVAQRAQIKRTQGAVSVEQATSVGGEAAGAMPDISNGKDKATSAAKEDPELDKVVSKDREKGKGKQKGKGQAKGRGKEGRGEEDVVPSPEAEWKAEGDWQRQGGYKKGGKDEVGRS